MSYSADKLLNNVFRNSNYHPTMGNTIEKKRTTNRSSHKYRYPFIQENGIMGVAIPKLLRLYILRDERATLIDSSTIKFGDECLRLVNIAVCTSKLFPSIMGTCDMINEYLQKELQRRHPKRYFHIIIAENNRFDFSTSDYSHFADIRQEQYRILIFSTKSKEKTKMDIHDANNQMKLQWKSVLIKK
jgi:hypothetical protein